MSKAFDKVNHYALFLKLMERHVPVCLINLLANWYENVFISVRWGQSLSKLVRLTTGVRQGGVLSPVLFAVYVNDIITRVESSGYGCEIAGNCVGILMYADDLLLISATCNGLRFVNKKWHGWICNSMPVSHVWLDVDRDTIKSVPTYF